jgi:hypothetical protein
MTKKYLPIIFLIGSFLLFACSSPNTPSNIEDQSIDPQQEQPEPTVTESLSQEEPPTEEPQQTPTMEAVTETAAESQVETNSLCYHPYFPIVDGASWTYDDDLDEDYTLRIEETDEESFRMIQEMLDEDIVYAVDWYCTEEGILKGSFGQADLINQAAGDEGTPEFQFETLEWEGQTLPSPELLEIGYTWTSFYQLSASLDIEGFSQTMNMDVIVDHEIIGMEEITVPAGTFPEALRVDSDGQINMFLVSDEGSTPVSSFDFGYSTWYVEGVGMVRSSSEISGFNTGVSLTDSSLLN